MKCAVIGGGVAGVTCAYKLCELDSENDVHLFSGSSLIQIATNFKVFGQFITSFNLSSVRSENVSRPPNLCIHSEKVQLDLCNKILFSQEKSFGPFQTICIATGSIPKPFPLEYHDELVASRILSIRDFKSVENLKTALQRAYTKNSRKSAVMVLGNGGISLESVYALYTGKLVDEILWAIKHESLAHGFLDRQAAEFFVNSLFKNNAEFDVKKCISTDDKSVVKGDYERQNIQKKDLAEPLGPALGPNWVDFLKTHELKVDSEKSISIQPFFETKIIDVKYNGIEDGLDVTIQHTANGETSIETTYRVDFIINAIGVIPNIVPQRPECSLKLKKSDDGGIVVDECMRTNLAGIYACGDVCSAEGFSERAKSDTWFQMRLWTQARLMGIRAGVCMNDLQDSLAQAESPDLSLDLFAHNTQFFGYQVTLLGKFRLEEFDKKFYDTKTFQYGNITVILYSPKPGRSENFVIIRERSMEQFIRVILDSSTGKMIGAILIGEVDLQETFENLILNGIDLRPFAFDILNPNFDVEDFFD